MLVPWTMLLSEESLGTDKRSSEHAKLETGITLVLTTFHVRLTTCRTVSSHVCCSHQGCAEIVAFGPRRSCLTHLFTTRTCRLSNPNGTPPSPSSTPTPSSSPAIHLISFTRKSPPWTTTRRRTRRNRTLTTKINAQSLKSRTRARSKHQAPQDVESTSRISRTRRPIPQRDQLNRSSDRTRHLAPREDRTSRNSHVVMEAAQLHESAAQQLILRLRGWSLRA
jgi:hypothetical protein